MDHILFYFKLKNRCGWLFHFVLLVFITTFQCLGYKTSWRLRERPRSWTHANSTLTRRNLLWPTLMQLCTIALEDVHLPSHRATCSILKSQQITHLCIVEGHSKLRNIMLVATEAHVILKSFIVLTRMYDKIESIYLVTLWNDIQSNCNYDNNDNNNNNVMSANA